MPLSARSTLGLVGSAVIVALTAGSPQRASAASGCALRAIPDHPSAAWEDALARARETLGARSGDCGEIVVEVEADFATLELTTTDGRRAVRVLHDPSDLAPVLDALLVTLPPAAVPPPSQSGPHGADAAQRTTPPEAPPTTTPVHVLLAGLAGARLAGPGPLLGPSALVAAGATSTHWEIGLLAQWTPLFAILDTDDASRPVRFSGLSAGVAVGRRSELVRDLTLVTGVTMSGAAQHEGWHAVDAAGKTIHADDDRGQALVGAYAAAVYPTTARTRFRTSLSGDVDATHVGENDPPTSGIPPLPWWALTLAFGVESEVL